MKKIILTLLCLIISGQTLVFADEIIDSKGNVIPCKIETIIEGLIEYYKGGNLYTFQREKDLLIFNDYVDVRTNLCKKNSITRMFGKIILKDSTCIRLRNENGDITIPWYRVKFVGIYKP